MEMDQNVRYGGCIVGNQYEVKYEIGRGGFGQVFLGYDRVNETDVAVKFQLKKGNDQLLNEAGWLSYLKNVDSFHMNLIGFPKVHYFDVYDNTPVLVMDLLGLSLDKLFHVCKSQFSLKTILLIFEQLLQRTQQLHRAGLIHSDLKPGNLVMGTGAMSGIIYFIDLGIAKSFYNCLLKRDHVECKHVDTSPGTFRFMSTNAHRFRSQSRRDDMESLAYVILHFCRGGQLPWQEACKRRDSGKHQDLLAMKSVEAETLFAGLPDEFAMYLNMIRKLNFDQEPEYLKYRRMFWALAKSNNITYDGMYDWRNNSQKEPTSDLD